MDLTSWWRLMTGWQMDYDNHLKHIIVNQLCCFQSNITKLYMHRCPNEKRKDERKKDKMKEKEWSRKNERKKERKKEQETQITKERK